MQEHLKLATGFKDLPREHRLEIVLADGHLAGRTRDALVSQAHGLFGTRIDPELKKHVEIVVAHGRVPGVKVVGHSHDGKAFVGLVREELIKLRINQL